MYDGVNDRLLDLGESDVSSAEIETTSLRMSSIRVRLQPRLMLVISISLLDPW